MEQVYYRTIYDTIYKNQSHLIPYFWMPKYVDADDCSARSLSIYSDESLLIGEEDGEDDLFNEEELTDINLND